MNRNLDDLFKEATNPEEILIQLYFYFSVLMEYQLNDLQDNVRKFVFAMSNAIQEMDKLVDVEGKSAIELYESLFSQGRHEEGSMINQRADKRVEDIFASALESLHPGETPSKTFNSDPNTQSVSKIQSESNLNSEISDEPIKEMLLEDTTPIYINEASDKIWSEIAKKFEGFCRMDERLRPQIFTMIQSLNFEDIQTQRIEHALGAQKKLNDGIVGFLKKGLHNCTYNEVKEFSIDLISKTRSSYTMTEERAVFDQVFIQAEKKKNQSRE